ncbi:class I SAM-dependent methyltransferase [Geothermobacter hydrogeniphilus]|nr:class I SAM-dependent methyltransferase [Geothermobacter hydrogeniphilus]
MTANRIAAHYARQNLEATIMAAIESAGVDLRHLSPQDLAPLDEFHVGGRRATLELARRLDLEADTRVLDVGCGLGGPSRCLALEFGCRVTGIDLCAGYCRLAETFARHLGLDERVCYRQGNALELPFADGSFDLLWTQHAAMNIADKAGLYAEMWRVLKPGGKLAIYDILSGKSGPVHFPVPWAREASISHLATAGQLRTHLETAGFQILDWRDTTAQGRDWFRRQGERIRKNGLPPLGIHLLLGNDFQQMARNQVRNLEEGRIALIEAIVKRP